ncbi:hypothetical protein TNCV_4438741 [Trichonephila clavipes]|nr:hypothetical protein TNCV_4438741 [Trichonephila clavipes]
MEFLTFSKIPVLSRILPEVTHIRTMISSTEGKGISTPYSSCDQNQTRVTCSHLSRSCHVEHACLGNVPSTYAEWPISIHSSMHDQLVD